MDMLDPRARVDRLPSPIFMPRDEDLIELLKSPDFDTRLQTLNRAMHMSKRDPDWFVRCTKKGELFKCLDRILAEDRWEVQHQCIRFLTEAMPIFGTGLEYCMCYVMPNVITKLGSSKITVRRVSVQLIQLYLKLQPEALGSLLKMFVNFFHSSPDRLAKSEVLTEVPALFIPEVSGANWATLIDGLTKWIGQADKETAEKIATVGKKLEVYVGKDAFARAFSTIPEAQQKDYWKHEKNVTIDEIPDAQALSRKRLSGKPSAEMRFRFGIVPLFVSAMVTDEDAAQRISGLEKLKQIIEKIGPDEINRLVPHLHSYLMTIGHVLSDLNFKVVVLSLDVLRLTVNRLKTHIEAHLQQVVSLLSKHFGNQKAVIKQLIMMTCMDLFQNIAPKSVVGALAVFLENRNSRMREEVVNILTSALMIISATKINFTAVINMLVPLLMDPKRRVRLAAFEQLSVVAYLMNGKLDCLYRAVREVEIKHNAQGLTGAVQARIRRQMLPRIRYDGLLEYSTPPVTDSSFDVGDAELASNDNMDLRWILHASGGEGMERPISPMSMVANFIRNEAPPPRVEKALPWEKDDLGLTHPMIDRGKSEDFSGRRNDSISNANSSTNSWHAPTRRSNSLVQEDRSVSAVINRQQSTQVEARLDASLEKVRRNAVAKKHELNNNTVTPVKRAPKVAAIGTSLSKSRSESNLVEEMENRPPVNYDDVPIRPAKNGVYMENEYGNGIPYSTPVKKSISHHSLPITNSHAPVKNTFSNPAKKQTFLKSGSANRAKPAAKPRDTSSKPAPERSKTISDGNVSTALRQISSEEWSDKADGLTMIADLSHSNPKQVADNLHEVVVAVLIECKNLRSSVSRVALSTLGTLFVNMKGKMDAEIEKVCVILMQKAGDVSNAFIREDASDALEKVVNHAHAGKTLHSILAAGSKSKNNTIRASCAQFVSTLIERVGPSHVLNNPDHLNKLIPHLIAFSRDQNPQVRTNGRQALLDLSMDSSFDRNLRKNVNESEYKAVKEIMGLIEKKGGVDALDSSSVTLASALSRAGSFRKSAPRQKLADGLQLDLDECRSELTASSWEKRLSGLQKFAEMANGTPKTVASDTRLIEAFIGRLSDINSKVSLEGLDTYLFTLPSMNKPYSSESHLKAVLNQLVLALMSHLSSKSEDHKHLAQTCLKETVKHIDSAALSPAIAAATKKANIKQKPYMLHVFGILNKTLYNSRPKQVEVVALPILWDSIRVGLADPDMKKAVSDYANGLARLMGEKHLLDQAHLDLDPPRRKILESLLR